MGTYDIDMNTPYHRLAGLPAAVGTVAGLRTVPAPSVTVGSTTITPFERVVTLRLGPSVVVRRRPWAVVVSEAGRVSRHHIPDRTRMAQAGITFAALFGLWALLKKNGRQREAWPWT